MKILCLGGGPAGLYFAISMKLRDPSHDVTVLERNKANDTFGWGVVLSDDALDQMQENDPQSTNAIRDNFSYWDDIAVEHNGNRTVSGGHGFTGIWRDKHVVVLGGSKSSTDIAVNAAETLALFHKRLRYCL
jgi:anthraniloyl-CoA monooxygenase